jgi:PQQ-dependent dehydrogenase (methanol/ethanol family)
MAPSRLVALLSSLCLSLFAAAQTAPSTTQTATSSPAPAAQSQAAANQPTTPEDGNWTQPGKNYGLTRYSGLDQINTSNAQSLTVKWTFSTGINRGHEAAPLVMGDTMYVVTPYPNILYALDLNKAAKNEDPLKWKYDPKPSSSAQGVACCDVVNRGCVYDNGRIFYNTLDAYTVAVDAKTGDEIWRTKIGEINLGETITMAPLVAKGKVYVGISGGEMGVRGRLTCLNASDGKIAWLAYNTGPDGECRIGPRFKPFYSSDQGKDLGVTTWPPGHWKLGGATVWGFVSYDPDQNLIFYGTSNPGCWNPEQRPGDNKWSCGIFARDADTGEAVWFYQTSPHDLFDHDGINESMILDLSMDGPGKPPRKVIVHPGRTGYMYVIDRTTGQVLSADAFTRITAAKGVDLTTGRLIPNPEKNPTVGKVIRDIQPAPPGAKDWQPCAFSPRTGWLYVPHQNLACDFESVEVGYISGTPYVGANVKMYAGPGGYRGKFMAWDPVAKKEIWSITENFPVWSGTCVTAGDVCFYGTMEGNFKAVDARTGKVLWQFRCGSGIIGQPMTYKGPDGKQCVAILAGVGGWAGAIVSGDLDPRDPTAALGFVNAMKDLPEHTTKGGMLYVFGLP